MTTAPTTTQQQPTPPAETRPAKPMTPFEQLIGGLKARRALFDAVLPKHMNVDRFMRSVLVAVTRQPKILDCNLESIYKCCHEAATLGLEVSGILGSAYLVPFKRDCTLIPGYRGLIGLARQSGEVETIDAFAVYENDDCRVQLGTEPSIHHVPKLDGSDRGKLKAVYAVAKIFNGGRQFVYMPRVDVEKVRDESNGYKASKQFKFPSPWDLHFEAMALKTAIRRLIKVLPISVEKLARAQELDEAHDEGKAPAPAVIDAEAFSKMVEDAQAAEKAAGAVGAVAAAVDGGKPAGEAAPAS